MNPQDTPISPRPTPTPPGPISGPEPFSPLSGPVVTPAPMLGSSALAAQPANEFGVASPIVGSDLASVTEQSGVNAGALSVASASPEEFVTPSPRGGNRKQWLRYSLLGLMLVVGTAALLVTHFRSHHTPLASNVNQEYPAQTIPLGSISSSAANQLSTDTSISINGRLNVNSALVLTPMVQPSNAVAGQLYYDAATNQLSYFNGKTFADVLTTTSRTVSNIGGLAGTVNLGAGLNVAGGLLSNAGVLSLQGQTGDVTLTAGSGIAVSGTTIANTGVLSLAGQTGNIAIGSGLSLLGGQLHSTGVLSVSAGNNILVTDDGSGNVTISAVGGSGGTSGTTGSGTGGTLALWDGSGTVNALASSLLSQSGGTVTIAGNLSVSGTISGTNLSGNGASVTNVDASQLNGQSAGYYQNAGNLNTGTLSDNRLSTNVATYDNATSNFTGQLQRSGYSVCDTSGNCVGTGAGGAIGGGGTINQIALFTGSGYTIGDSILSQDAGATTVTIGGGLNASGTITAHSFSGDGGGLTGVNAAELEGENGSYYLNANNIDAGTLSDSRLSSNAALYNRATSNFTGGLQQNGYNVCTTAGNCVGTGNGGIGGGGTVGTLAIFTGTGYTVGDSILTQSATAGSVSIAGDLHVSGAVIATTLSGNGANVTNVNAVQLEGADASYYTDASNIASGTLNDARLSNNTALYDRSISNFTGSLQHNGNDVCDLSGNCAGAGGGVTTSGGTVSTFAIFTGSQTIGNSILSQDTGATTVTASGNISASGTITANAFSGNGANVTNVNAAQLNGQAGSYYTNAGNLASGTLSNARLNSDVATYDHATSNFTGSLQQNGNTVCTTAGNCVGTGSGGAIGGSGTANRIALFSSGGYTIGDSILSQDAGATTVTIGGGLSVTGSVSATSLNGDGANVTNVNAAQLNGQAGSYYTNASNISSGTLDDARLSNTVTLQGNVFNGANQLLQLNASGYLPALNGSLLTSLNGSAITSGVVGAAQGGTGVDGSAAADGQILIGNGTGYTLTTITPGSGITITNGSGSIGIGIDSTVCRTTNNCSASGTAGGDLSGAYPNPTVAKIRGTTVSFSSLVSGDVLQYNGTAIVNAPISDANLTSGTYSHITGTGTLNAGSIGSSFGAINNGSSGITSTGTIAGSIINGGTINQNGHQVCDTSGNCASGIGGSGTANAFAIFTASQTIGNSILSQNSGGTTITVSGDLTASGTVTATSFSGNGSGVTNVNAAELTGQTGSYYTNAGNLNAGSLSDSRLTSNVALYNNATSDFAGALQQNGYNVCTTFGNCVGVPGGAIGGSGTTNTIALFTTSGTIGNSILSQSSTTLTVAGNTTITGSLNTDGASLNGSQLTFSASGAATITSAANQNLTIQAPGTGALILSSGSGTIATTSDITALALNATGYKTTDTGTAYAGQWTLLGTCPLPAQSLACHTKAALTNVGTNQGVTQRATLDIQVAQQDPLGSAPAVSLTLINASGISSSDIAAVTAQNDASGTIVQIWGRLNSNDVTWAIAPLLNAGGVSFGWLQKQGFQATTPTAPTATAQYADNMANSLSINDMLVLDNTGRLQTAALSGEYDGALTLANASNIYYGSGANLTSLNAGNISSGVLGVNHGGTGANSIGPAGSIAYSDGSQFAFSGVGNIGQCLQSAGSNLPLWADCSNGATSVGTLDSGVITQDGGYITSGVLYLQSASPSHAGLVNAGVQSFAGAKTFTSDTTIASTSSNAFQVQDATGNNVFKVNAASGFVGIGTSSPQTLLDVGVSQGGTYPATAHAGIYSCNSGDSLSGTTCTHSTTYTGTYSAAYYYCPSGGSLNGTQCDTGTYAASYQSGYYYCPNGGSLSGSTCSYAATPTQTCTHSLVNGGCYIGDGYATGPNLNQCPNSSDFIAPNPNDGRPDCFQSQPAWTYGAPYTCPSGGSVSGTTCSYGASYASGYYYCASGGSISGTTCTSYYNASYQAAYYSCTAGDSLSGSTCTHSTTYGATQGPTTYSCTPPDILSGTTCTTTNTVSALIEGRVGIGTGSVTPLNYTKAAIPGGALSYSGYSGYNDSCAAYSSAMGDFNGDGKPDMVYACASSALYVALGTSSGGFGTSTAYTTNLATTYNVAVGDFNGDGKLDIAAANYGNATVAIFYGNGDGTFNATPTVIGVGSSPWSITTGDFNGDGKLDFAVTYVGNTLGVFINNGSGTAFTQTSITTKYAMTSAGTGDIVAADVNGDGKMDILAISYNSYELMVLTNSGSGTSYTETDYATQTYPYDIAVGDFNGDGKPDIAVPNYNSATLSTYLNNGSGGFTVQPTFSSNYSSPSSVAVGDFNGDGKPDLLVGYLSGATTAVFLGNGDGTFGTGNYYATGYSYPYTVNAVDMNGDGKPDIVIPSRNSAAISVLINQTTFPVAASTHGATVSIQTEVPTDSGLTIQGSAGQTGDLLHVQDASGTALLGVSASGDATLMVNGAQSTTGAHPLQDKQPPSQYTGSTSNYNWGYKFTPNSNGKITQLGAACTNGAALVTLYDASGTVLATASVTATTTYNDWHYANITPVNVTAGAAYYVAANSTSGYYCYTSYTMPVTVDGITINDAAYSTSNGFPNNLTTSEMYGYADITFVGSGTAAIFQGSVGIGITAPNNALSVAGNIAATGTISGGVASPDYAENIGVSDQSIGAGDVVAMNPDGSGTVVKASRPYSSSVLGVISTHPGFVTNASGVDTVSATDQRPLALSGRVPVKVSTENGPIQVGDYLTSSDIPGVAMKATGNGAVIGVAMQNFDGSQNGVYACGIYTCGTVLFFINPSASNPATSTLQGSDAAFTSVAISGALTAQSINIGGLATLGSLTVTGDASFEGTVAISGDITLSAHLLTTGTAPTLQTLTAAGTARATASVSGNDISGVITVTTGPSTTVGDLLKLIFAKAYAQTPHVMITPNDASSAQLLVYASGSTTGSFNLSAAVQPQAGTTYTFTYYVVQ